MLQEERFFNIVEYLKANNTAKLGQLSKLNNVSVDTVRRDLEVLEGYGVLERVRGGAIWHQENLERHVFGMRGTMHNEEKHQLARLVNYIVEDGQTVVLGSGTTTVEIAKVFAQDYKRLTIITNDMDVVRILSHKEHFTIIVAGGVYDIEENATYGEQCEEELMQYNGDISILAVNSISLEKGITDFRLNQIDVFKTMIKISDRIVIAADYSKFEKNACGTICGIGDVDLILSDSKLTDEQKLMYERQGVQVMRPSDKGI